MEGVPPTRSWANTVRRFVRWARRRPSLAEDIPPLGAAAVGVVGLPNLGNTCYMNSVMQALSTCDLFCSQVQQCVRDTMGPASYPSHDLRELTRGFVQLLWELRQGSSTPNPRPLFWSIAAACPEFRLSDQQDAEEFLKALLNRLRTESAGAAPPAGLQLLFRDKRDGTRTLGVEGQAGSFLRCAACGRCAPIRSHPFVNVSLSLENSLRRRRAAPYAFGFAVAAEAAGAQHFAAAPERSAATAASRALPGGSSAASFVTLEECLAQFVAAEVVDGVECDGCKARSELRLLQRAERVLLSAEVGADSDASAGASAGAADRTRGVPLRTVRKTLKCLQERRRDIVAYVGPEALTSAAGRRACAGYAPGLFTCHALPPADMESWVPTKCERTPGFMAAAPTGAPVAIAPRSAARKHAAATAAESASASSLAFAASAAADTDSSEEMSDSCAEAAPRRRAHSAATPAGSGTRRRSQRKPRPTPLKRQTTAPEATDAAARTPPRRRRPARAATQVQRPKARRQRTPARPASGDWDPWSLSNLHRLSVVPGWRELFALLLTVATEPDTDDEAGRCTSSFSSGSPVSDSDCELPPPVKLSDCSRSGSPPPALTRRLSRERADAQHAAKARDTTAAGAQPAATQQADTCRPTSAAAQQTEDDSEATTAAAQQADEPAASEAHPSARTHSNNAAELRALSPIMASLLSQSPHLAAAAASRSRIGSFSTLLSVVAPPALLLPAAASGLAVSSEVLQAPAFGRAASADPALPAELDAAARDVPVAAAAGGATRAGDSTSGGLNSDTASHAGAPVDVGAAVEVRELGSEESGTGQSPHAAPALDRGVAMQGVGRRLRAFSVESPVARALACEESSLSHAAVADSAAGVATAAASLSATTATTATTTAITTAATTTVAASVTAYENDFVTPGGPGSPSPPADSAMAMPDILNARTMTALRNWRDMLTDLAIAASDADPLGANIEHSCSMGRVWNRNARQSAHKRLAFTRLPDLLCLHVQRRVVDAAGMAVKLCQHVRFPEVLDMLPFCAYDGISRPFFDREPRPHLRRGVSACSRRMFRLMAVIEHFGSANGGHYVSYRRVPAHVRLPEEEVVAHSPSWRKAEGDATWTASHKAHSADAPASSDRWVLISDQSVHAVDAATVFAAQAYLLFYERME